MNYINDIATGKVAVSALNDHIHLFARHQSACAMQLSEKNQQLNQDVSRLKAGLKKAGDEINAYNMDIEDCAEVTSALYTECTANMGNVAHTMAHAIRKHNG
jgi:hypothetical protein